MNNAENVDKFLGKVSNLADAFWWKMDALLEVMDVSLPEVAKLDSKEQISSAFSKAFLHLNSPEMKKLREILRKIEVARKEEPDSPATMVRMWEEVRSEPWGPKMMMTLHEATNRPPREPLFLQSTTVAAVSNFEVLFAGIAAQYYWVAPQALEALPKEKEKEFSLRELKAMSSLDDAVELAIARRVDDLMFGSFGEWRKFFQDKMNLKFEDYAIDWELLQEVFQRRHVIVHNGGRASRRYLRSVAERFTADVKVDDNLKVDQDYVRRAATELLNFGYLLSIATCLKFSKSQDHKDFTEGYLHKFTYRNLLKGHYEVVSKCAGYGEDISNSMDGQIVFRINHWIARQRLGDESVGEEVKDWDTRPLKSRYTLARHCLMGDIAEAVKLLTELYDAGEVSFEEIIEWPMLEPLRGTSDYVKLTRRLEVPAGWSAKQKVLFENPKSAVIHDTKCPLVGPGFKRRLVSQISPEEATLCKKCKPTLST
ncbi:hypothetical protein [Streptomyces lydicamycinicus]|uniref:hypothetical protein n=1 Tax=Streptomyces lydicamycinicus TaxID=1546107 RepID=UPI003C2AD07A